MNKSLIGSLIEMIRSYRLRVIFAFVLVLLSNLLIVLNPLILRQAIMALVPGQFEEPTLLTRLLQKEMGSLYHCPYGWAFLMIGIGTAAAALKYYMRMIFITMGREVELQLRQKLFDRLQAQSKIFFDKYGIGDLLSRLTNDISAYRDLLGPGLMYPIFFSTLLIPVMIALFTLSPLMASVTLIPLFVIYGLNSAIRQPLYHLARQVQESLGSMSGMVHEHYSGIRIVKAYALELKLLQKFKRLGKNFQTISMRFGCFQGMVFPFLTLIIKSVSLLIVVVAGGMIAYRTENFNAADFLSFMWLQSYLFTPLLMLGWILPMYQKGKAAYGRLVEIYEEPIELQERAPNLNAIEPQDSIVIKDLTFSYPHQMKAALRGINLTIPSGAFIGITGPVGSGKTTLFRLLNREYEIPENKILIGGKDIHSYRLSAFHQAIVMVEQMPFLFSKSIQDNIGFGLDLSEEKLEKVSRQADIYDTIKKFPQQFSTVVGERGISLSGGQKQRIAIARAFLTDRPILLLDDIFSSLDTETEHRVFEAIKANFSGKTVLLVTHRVSILEQLDRLIYMKEGKIVEEGTPEELVRKKGFYEALYNLQKRDL
ncbi:MAG: ABC transporter ATP-binding protein/permease [Parachlamydia sp.]|nr:ABC transporter ATP-binding protein/permease [Parachlamydia sp.]